MARALTPTLLPLDRFAQILGLHPLHFNQVVLPNLAEGVNCVKEIYQHPWQKSDAVGREEIAQAIAGAEAVIGRYLGYDPLVKWNSGDDGEGERIDWTNPIYNWNYQLRAKRGYMVTGGQETRTLLDSEAMISYTDEDNDGYSETATITVPGIVAAADEIEIYYPDEDGDAGWRIPTRRVTISSGVATIVGRRENFVKKELLESYNPGAVDGLVNDNFLAVVDVYRHYNDPSRQVEFYWRNTNNCYSCSGAGCNTCGLSVETGCMTVTDARLGLFSSRRGEWDADESVFTPVTDPWCNGFPNYVRIWYKAGLKRMPVEWEQAITYLAITRLDRPICSCHGIDHVFNVWTTDLRRSVATSGKSTAYQLSRNDLENPIGTKQGELNAWHLIESKRLGVLADEQ